MMGFKLRDLGRRASVSRVPRCRKRIDSIVRTLLRRDLVKA